jgi:hypothetical protein
MSDITLGALWSYRGKPEHQIRVKFLATKKTAEWREQRMERAENSFRHAARYKERRKTGKWIPLDFFTSVVERRKSLGL